MVNDYTLKFWNMWTSIAMSCYSRSVAANFSSPAIKKLFRMNLVSFWMMFSLCAFWIGIKTRLVWGGFWIAFLRATYRCALDG